MTMHIGDVIALGFWVLFAACLWVGCREDGRVRDERRADRLSMRRHQAMRKALR